MYEKLGPHSNYPSGLKRSWLSGSFALPSAGDSRKPYKKRSAQRTLQEGGTASRSGGRLVRAADGGFDFLDELVHAKRLVED